MTIEAQDVIVENQVPATEEVQVEAQEVVNTDEGADAEAEEVVDSVDKEEVEVDPVKRLEEVQKTYDALEKKVKRQTAAYSNLQKKYESTMQQLEQSVKDNPKPDLEEPEIDNYETLEEFQAARDKYIEDRTKKDLEQQILQKQQYQQQQALQVERNKIYEASKKASVEKYPDFVRAESEVNEFLVEAAKTVPADIQNAIAEQLYDDPESVGDVVYYFGANNGERIDELVELSKQSPRKAAISLYKLQQQLKSAPTQKERETTPSC